MADLALTAAQIAPVNETQYVAWTMIAAVDITAGQLVYENSAGKAALARANATGTIQGLVGVATHAAKAGRPVEVVVEGALYGFTLSGMAYGAIAYASAATAGAISDAAIAGSGNFNVPIGKVKAMTDKGTLTKVLWIDVPQAAAYTALP